MLKAYQNFARYNLSANWSPLKLRKVIKRPWNGLGCERNGIEIHQKYKRVRSPTVENIWGYLTRFIGVKSYESELVDQCISSPLLEYLHTKYFNCGKGFSRFRQKVWPSGPDEWKCHDDPPASELSGAALNLP